MNLKNVFCGFRPKNKGPAFGGDFEVWEPLRDYAKEEQEGNVAYDGPELPAITTKTTLPPVVPLSRLFGDLLERVWVKAETPTGPQRNMLAQTRQAKAAGPQPTPYAPMVAPIEPGAMNMLSADQKKHLTNLANDWDLHKNLERCSGYFFRGDGRDPDAIKSAGGFKPPASRQDDAYIKGVVYQQFCGYLRRRFNKDLQATMTPDEFLAVVRETVRTEDARETMLFYTAWRAIVKREELHLGRMLAEEALKAYISTTKAVTVAKGFADEAAARLPASKSGWVYCLAVLGGFVVPQKGATQWTRIFGEQEIASPRPIPWTGIAAARAVRDKKFVGDLYVRRGFDRIDPGPFETIFKLMSGKKQ
jgi:hypothetical protein